jgi:hypothetical protein
MQIFIDYPITSLIWLLVLLGVYCLGFREGGRKAINCIKNVTVPKFMATIIIDNFKIKSENLMTEVPFGAKSVEISFGAPKDKFDNPAKIEEGSLKIESTDSEILTVEQSEVNPDNPYACKVVFTGKAGVAQVKISADADLGEGVKTIEGAASFETVAGEATGFGAPVVGEFEMPQ